MLGIPSSTIRRRVKLGLSDDTFKVEVIVRGVPYPSFRAAGLALGLSANAIKAAKKNGRLDRVGIKDTVIIEGVEYPSKAEAARQLGLSISTLKDRLKKNVSVKKPRKSQL